MTGFSTQWLALREPHDTRARNAGVLAAVRETHADLPSITVVDLACGTGSTRRAIAPALPQHQHWTFVDNDLSLLARAADFPVPVGSTIRATPVDLMRDLEAALDGACDLVTCSALLDLVSETWLDRLVTECAARRLPLYAALTYDGRIALKPQVRTDAQIIDAVNRHQKNDKGFGPALGPDAASALIRRFGHLDYQVSEGPSDWDVGSADADMQRATLTQWALAAREVDVMSAANIASWLEQRLEFVAAGHSRLRVGHVDIFARPTQRR
jgi:SAM-dependent methyltransferase